MEIKAIIFDLDGVLVHTDHYHYKAWKEVADKNQLNFGEQMNHLLRGVSREESLNIILSKNNAHFSLDQKRVIIEEKNNIYKKLILQMKEEDVDSKVKETLLELKKVGFQLAIGSSSKNTKTILKQTNLISLFDAICDGTMIKKSKPDPEVFLKAAKLLHKEPFYCIVVEDAIAGIQAGKGAGMLTIAVGDASQNKVGDFNITDFTEIKTILTPNQNI